MRHIVRPLPGRIPPTAGCEIRGERLPLAVIHGYDDPIDK